MNRKCPKCYEGVLLSWHELSEEGQEVVKRLPASADYEAAEREALHQWCNCCWFESLDSETQA